MLKNDVKWEKTSPRALFCRIFPFQSIKMGPDQYRIYF